MSVLSDFFHNIRNTEGLTTLITGGGYAILAGIVFAETGLLVGFFLPGDSLLVVAGVLAKSGLLNIFLLNALLITMAIVGDFVGYQLGKKAGPALFKRPESLLFKPKYLRAAQEFYEKHGGKAIVIARFMPFVRTFAPVVAGIGQMPYSQFVRFNVIGALSWVISMTMLGYVLAGAVDPKRIEQIVYLIIFISVAPLLYSGLRAWLKNRNAAPANKDAPEADPAAPANKDAPKEPV